MSWRADRGGNCKLPSVVSKLTSVVGSRSDVSRRDDPDGGAASSKGPAGSSASQAAAGEGAHHDAILRGRYRQFFEPEHHEAVHDWYYTTADGKQRHDFKTLVKAILEFDADAAQRSLPPTQFGDIATGSAIVRSHGGNLLRPEMRDRAATFLSYAPTAVREDYRRVFGYIQHIPYVYRETAYTLHYDPGRKFFKGEKMHQDASRKAFAQSREPKPSEPLTFPCDVIGDGKTAYRTTFAWKVAPKSGVNIQQRAHEASCAGGAPYGKLGDLGPVMYETQTAAFFKDTYYDAPQPRRFQNYNDNFTHALYKSEKLKKTGRLSAEMLAKASTAHPFTPTKAVTHVMVSNHDAARSTAAAASSAGASPAPH